MSTRPSLDELGLLYNTDKSSDRHAYTRHYARLFESRRDEPLTFLELGVYDGASTAMWEAYFPKARLFALDIDPRCTQYQTARSKVFIGDQTATAFLQALAAETGPLDIVIDDASHNGDASRTSFEFLYPLVKPGGIYVVEDLHTSFFCWGSSFVEYAKGKLDGLIWPGGHGFSHGHGDPRNHEEWHRIAPHIDTFYQETMAIEFLSSLVVFKKFPDGWEMR